MAELCRQWDYSPNHVYVVLRGHREGSAGLKDRLAQYVGVPYTEFWGSDQANGGSSIQQEG